MNRVRTNLYYDRVRLGVLLRLSGFPGLAASIRTLLLCPLMRVRFFVVVAAFAAEEEQDFLSVSPHNRIYGFLPTRICIVSGSPVGAGAICSVVRTPCSLNTRTRAFDALRVVSLAAGSIIVETLNSSMKARNPFEGSTIQPAFVKTALIWPANAIASLSSWYVTKIYFWPANSFNAAINGIAWTKVMIRGARLCSNFNRATRSCSAIWFASAAARFASSARAFASAIARSLACFSSRLWASVDTFNWRLIRREAMEVRPPAPASTAPMTTSQNESESQNDADDSSDITIALAFCTVLFTTLIALFRSNSRQSSNRQSR